MYHKTAIHCSPLFSTLDALDGKQTIPDFPEIIEISVLFLNIVKNMFLDFQFSMSVTLSNNCLMYRNRIITLYLDTFFRWQWVCLLCYLMLISILDWVPCEHWHTGVERCCCFCYCCYCWYWINVQYCSIDWMVCNIKFSFIVFLHL